jgi:type II secretory pathway component PulF
MAIWNAVQIADSAGALGNQLLAAVPLNRALERMALLQPRQADFWRAAGAAVGTGQRLSLSLQSVWPEALVNAVKAGEESGRLDEVFLAIERASQLQGTVKKAFSQLIYPVSMAVAASGVFVFFMVWVLPTMGKTLKKVGSRKSELGTIFEVSFKLNELFMAYWPWLAGGLVVVLLALAVWLQSEEGQDTVLTWMLTLPRLGPALTDLYFGIWANYMALVTAAGIPTIEALRSVGQILPKALQPPVAAIRTALLEAQHMAQAVEPDPRRADDPRSRLPFYISNAFQIAERTGEVDREMLRASPRLITEGLRKVDALVAILKPLAVGVAAIMIATPFTAYYSEFFKAVKSIS